MRYVVVVVSQKVRAGGGIGGRPHPAAGGTCPVVYVSAAAYAASKAICRDLMPPAVGAHHPRRMQSSSRG